MRLLVLTSEIVDADRLRAAMPRSAGGEDTEVMVLAPALQASAFRFWTSDSDEAIARAREVREATVSDLAKGGIQASGDTGESDPFQAIQDALQTFPADRILLFTHEAGDQRYREDIDPAEVRERFGIPTERMSVSG